MRLTWDRSHSSLCESHADGVSIVDDLEAIAKQWSGILPRPHGATLPSGSASACRIKAAGFRVPELARDRFRLRYQLLNDRIFAPVLERHCRREWGCAPATASAGNPLDYVAGYLGAFGAMVALARRAVEGGSYRVRVSLAQTGRWVESLGRVQGEDARLRPPLSHEDLGPIVGLFETPPYWARPAAPLGSHPSRWPA